MNLEYLFNGRTAARCWSLFFSVVAVTWGYSSTAFAQTHSCVGDPTAKTVYQISIVPQLPQGELFSRWSPVLEKIGSNEADVDAVLSRLEHVVDEPIDVDTRLIKVRFSIGVALYPRDGTDASSLIARADEAMYQSKERHEGRWEYWRSTPASPAHHADSLTPHPAASSGQSAS